MEISVGAVDSVYAEAGKRLAGFIAALVTLLKTLPVLHVDETSDRLETKNCWMHVISASLYTFIHASVTRGEVAIDEMGVLRGYRGVIVHDRLAMYWKLKRAKHQACGAHLLRDLADVAVVATQTAWAAGLGTLLVEVNRTCHEARRRGWRQLDLSTKRSVLEALRRARRHRTSRQPGAGKAEAQPSGAEVLQPRHGLCHPQGLHPAVHERPWHSHDEQRRRETATSFEVTSEGFRLFPKPRRGRALCPRAQLPRHDPEERRLGHGRPHAAVRRQSVDAPRAGVGEQLPDTSPSQVYFSRSTRHRRSVITRISVRSSNGDDSNS